MSTMRRRTIQGAANLDKAFSYLDRPHRRPSEIWKVNAKLAGYPLCEQCQEPIRKSEWGKQTLCWLCRDLNARTY